MPAILQSKAESQLGASERKQIIFLLLSRTYIASICPPHAIAAAQSDRGTAICGAEKSLYSTVYLDQKEQKGERVLLDRDAPSL